MTRSSNGGTTHYLACGCANCRNYLQREFADIIYASYTDKQLDKLVKQTHELIVPITDRVNAYTLKGDA